MLADSDASSRRLLAIRVPELGEEPGPVRVSSWLVSVDEAVSSGDRLVELVIPGVTIDVASNCDGMVEQIVLAEGASVSPGCVLGWLRPGEVHGM